MNRRATHCMLLLSMFISIADWTRAQEGSKIGSLPNKEKYIPDIGTFMQIGDNAPAGYGWDGKDVYFTSSMSGARQVYRITEAGWPYQLSTFEDGIDFFDLSYGGSMAVVGASAGGSEQSQLYLMDTETGRTVRLTDFEDVRFGSVFWARDDRSIFYRSNQENARDFFIYEMDIVTGRSTKVFGDTSGAGGYNSVADVSLDNTKLIIYNFASRTSNNLYLVDLTTGRHQRLTDSDGDALYGTPTLMPDNRTIWLTCNDNAEGVSRLATMAIDSPDVEYVNDGWVDPRWEIESVGFSDDYAYLVAIYNEDGYVRMKLRDVAGGKELPAPPLDGIIGGGAFDRNGACLISFNGPTRAPDAWRWNPLSGELRQLTFSTYAGIDRSAFAEPRLVHYKSYDGLEIPAFLYLPPGYKDGAPIPFVVYAHGGPADQFKPRFIRNFQYMLLNGYGILAPNPRGSIGYGREYMALDDYKNRRNSLKDYRAGVKWLIQNRYSERGMIGIRGASYGGYVVLGMITEYPDLFSAAVDVGGIANFETFLENTKAYRRTLAEAEYGPLSDSAFLESISPIHKAHLIRTPLLVIHGENDTRVPVSEARQIIEAVKKSGGVVDSLIFSDEGHHTLKTANVIAKFRKQVEFFDRYLKAGREKKGP